MLLIFYAASYMYTSSFPLELLNHLQVVCECLLWHREDSFGATFVHHGGNPQMCESASSEPANMGGMGAQYFGRCSINVCI